MTISDQSDVDGLDVIGRIAADVLQAMAASIEIGMTTAELDALGRTLLERDGARSAPELCYNFPGATCISVNEEAAHGIPGSRRLAPGDLVNIDVSAEKGGYFADTGASFVVPPATSTAVKLCRDGRRAMWEGIRQVRPGASLAEIGQAVGKFASRNGYTLIRNLASHGVGRSLHEDPEAIATWPDPSEKRRMSEGMVFTVEPFLSLGGEWADPEPHDEWTLFSRPRALTVQYEHTLIVTKRGPHITTLPTKSLVELLT